jgi:hypothetical protein
MYELSLTADPAAGNEVQITGFRLAEIGAGAAMFYARGGPAVIASGDPSAAEIANLQKELTKEKEKSSPDPAKTDALQAQMQQSRASALARLQARAVIDTSFRMSLGETVVVGTSRLQGSKALVVLLTAVGK